MNKRIAVRSQSIAAGASAGNPHRASWGLCCVDDGPGSPEGVSRSLLWFDSRVAMLEYTGMYLTYVGSEPRLGWDEAAARVRATIEALSAGRLNDDAALLDINEHLQGCVQLLWWGPFAELLTGEGVFPVEVRTWWFEEADDPDGDSSHDVPIIDDDLVEEFAEDLWQFGISA
jgi:hypothetical protein